MTGPKAEDGIQLLSKEPNPYCPLCGEMKADVAGGQEADADARTKTGQDVGHSCLLSILNAFYAGSRNMEIEDKG